MEKFVLLLVFNGQEWFFFKLFSIYNKNKTGYFKIQKFPTLSLNFPCNFVPLKNLYSLFQSQKMYSSFHFQRIRSLFITNISFKDINKISSRYFQWFIQFSNRFNFTTCTSVKAKVVGIVCYLFPTFIMNFVITS